MKTHYNQVKFLRKRKVKNKQICKESKIISGMEEEILQDLNTDM